VSRAWCPEWSLASWARVSVVTLAGATLIAHAEFRPQDVPQPVAPQRLPRVNAELVRTSRLLATLDEDAALYRKLDAQPVVGRGTLASGFSARPITLEDGRTESLAGVAGQFLDEQDALATEARAVRPGARILAAPAGTTDDVLEFDDAYAVVHATSVTVADPGAFAQASPEFRTIRGEPRVPASLSRASLPEASRPGYDAFVRDELPALPDADPLRRAWQSGGEQALLRAIAEGAGTYEMIDTLFVPKVFATLNDGRAQRPAIRDGVVRYDLLQPVAGLFRGWTGPDQGGEYRRGAVAEPPDAPPPSTARATVTAHGRVPFETQFMAGFTRGKTWEWERRWRFPSGFFRLTLRGYYSIGLRIPIQVSGDIEPTSVVVRDHRDQVVPVRARVSARTVDGDEPFFRAAGMPDGQNFHGQEAVCGAGFGWGLRFRALWSNILHVPNHDIADFDISDNFKPPFGRDPDASYRLVIPTSLTGTSFRWGAVRGAAEAGLKFDGKGTVHLDVEPFAGDRLLPVQHAAFTSEAPRSFDFLLPALAPRGQAPVTQPFGFTLSHPAYAVDLTMTPQIHARVTVGYDWVSHTFDTGWKSLNALKVRMGTLTLGRHARTRPEFRVAAGEKRFEPVAGAAGPSMASYRAALKSAQARKYVRAGVGEDGFLTATSDRVGGWETFDVVPVGPGLVALRCLQNRKFVRVGRRVDGADHLVAASTRADVLETFRLEELGQGRIALKSLHTDKYVRAGVRDQGFLVAASTEVRSWETFILERLEPAR
jgi:hypothetical protein